jgi:hypothetical protein
LGGIGVKLSFYWYINETNPLVKVALMQRSEIKECHPQETLITLRCIKATMASLLTPLRRGSVD